jgi:Na+/H+ antiporter NhaD/arsenite permease-like protein
MAKKPSLKRPISDNLVTARSRRGDATKFNLSTPATAYVHVLANSFGGSLIIVGSVSNVVVVQQARELGVPVTLAGLVGWAVLIT